jgi:hypothetical protein
MVVMAVIVAAYVGSLKVVVAVESGPWLRNICRHR